MIALLSVINIFYSIENYYNIRYVPQKNLRYSGGLKVELRYSGEALYLFYRYRVLLFGRNGA